MATKPTITSVSSAKNLAIFISSYTNNELALQDIEEISNWCIKNNFKIIADDKIKSNLPEEVKLKVLNPKDFFSESQTESVIPLNFPLKTTSANVIKWVSNCSKIANNNNILIANGTLSSKAGFIDKHHLYWNNFWTSLFTGIEQKMSHSELVLLPNSMAKEFLFDKKIQNPIDIASLASQNKISKTIDLEHQANEFSWLQSFKPFFKAPLLGLKSIKNSFFTSINSSSNEGINLPVFKKIFFFLSLFLLIFMAFISQDYNVTWDEPNHHAYTKDVMKYYSSFGSDTTMFDFQKAGHRDYVSNVYYGMSVDLISNVIHSIIGGENEYVTRHFIFSIVGFLSILFTGLLVRLMSGWLPAVVAMLAMVCSPSYFGHCFNNPKDIPFAAGYIMSLYYIIKLLKEMPNPKHQTKVMLAISIGFAISIRVQGVLALVYFGMALSLYWLLFQFKQKDKKWLFYLKTGLVVGIGAYLLGILLWPYALRSPITGVFTALKEFSNFGFLTYYELFEGTRQYIKPWYYEPKMIMITAPILILIGFVLGILLGFIKKDKVTFLAFFILVFATFFPTVYTIYKKSYLYNGWRHFIFIYPAMVSIALLGFYYISTLINKKIATYVVFGILTLSFVKPAIWSLKNHPYQYMYYNEIVGGVAGANGNYELDYWNQTPRAAFKWLLENRPEVTKGDIRVNSNNGQESLKAFNPKGKDVKYKWTREYEWTDDDWGYAIWTSRTLNKNQILGKYWPPKGTIHEIKIDGVTVAAVVELKNKFSSEGKKYLNKNNADSAILFYKQAINYNPLEEEYYRGIGQAYRLKQNQDSAIYFFQKALELRDGNYEAYFGLGENTYFKALSNPQNPDVKLVEKAKEYFKQAAFYKENFTGAFYYLAEICAGQNQLDEALEYYAEYFEKGQANQQVFERFSQLLKQSGRTGEEQDPYYYLFERAKSKNDKQKEEMYLLYHEQMMSGGK